MMGIISGFYATHTQILIVILKYHSLLELHVLQRFFLCWLDFRQRALFFSINKQKKNMSPIQNLSLTHNPGPQ